MADPSHPSERVIETSILINAPLDKVRFILLDFHSYPKWSSFITSIEPQSESQSQSQSQPEPQPLTPSTESGPSIPSQPQISVGDKLKVALVQPGNDPSSSSPMIMTPTIVHLDSNGYGWLGQLGFPGVFDGKHLFLLSPEAEGEPGEGSDADGKQVVTRLVQREEFSGVLYTPLMKWMGMGTKTLKGFEAFNKAVKAEAERV